MTTTGSAGIEPTISTPLGTFTSPHATSGLLVLSLLRAMVARPRFAKIILAISLNMALSSRPSAIRPLAIGHRGLFINNINDPILTELGFLVQGKTSESECKYL